MSDSFDAEANKPDWPHGPGTEPSSRAKLRRPMSGETMQPGAQHTSGIHLWLVLWKAFNAVQARAMADIECLGLCLSDFAILELLLHKGPTPVNEIGCKVKLTSGSMSVAIDRLESKNLVERRKDARDARTRIIHLTDAGRALIVPAF